MPDLLAARSQMAMSLGFHIIFAVVGVAMPVLMVLAERRWQRTREPVYLDLAERWAKGTAILFAVGAVSGTVLSFELGLLWPRFMRYAGAVIGMPFSLEGFAFFTEAIFLGVFLYGRDRIPPAAHLASGILVAVSGAASAVFVVIANAWMNSPRGFDIVNGQPANIHPFAAMWNPATVPQTLHMLIAAYAATGLAVAGIHAWMLRRDPGSTFHRAALRIALLVGAPAAIIQPLSGDISARYVARWQPAKLAAMESQFRTETGAPLRIGGWPDVDARETHLAIEIPRGLSLLAFHDPNATVKGLEAVPRDEWPPVPIVHVAFQVMVGLGTIMALVSLWAVVLMARRRDLAVRRRLLAALVAVSPMGIVALEAGWTVTEVGRQPWVVYGLVRTADGVTPMPGLIVPFLTFTALYLFLGVVVVVLLRRHVLSTRPGVSPA
ncbi:MAG TPA: cytochrome ubiquinol oxidase subunit I [Gemmatimonadaceae bacterium]|nr:cytochrome ubiquinol oxidase subunit I [Gemmatimonadaceae bacterium]